jgi:hypothetical protein
MTDDAEIKELGWFAKLFRKQAKLTYWLDQQAYVVNVCHFKEISPECIVFSDYFTKKNTMVKYRNKITYVLEQVK